MSKQKIHEQVETDKSRRQFLGQATAFAGVTLAPGVLLYEVAQAKAPEEAVTDKVRWGMLVDANKCASGCTDCVSACNKENGLQGHDRPATDAQWIRKVALKDKQTGHTKEMPLMCQHCKHPPCVDVCPTGASFRRDDGIVLVDKHLCIGCRYCMMACPYKARSFIHETVTDQKSYAPRGKGTVESCTLCVHRVDADGTPACVESCKEGALVFGDINNPDSKISKQLKKHGGIELRSDLALDLGVRYQGF